MIVAGIDLSLTATGIVIADAGMDISGPPACFKVAHDEVLRPGDRKGMERIAWTMSRIRALLLEHHVSDIAIEGYAFSKLTTHAHAQGELGGVVRLAIWQRGLSWWEVTPATLKKIVAGKGDARKDVMLREVFRRWQYEAVDSNAADAYALARALAGHHFGFERKADKEAWDKAERVAGRPTEGVHPDVFFLDASKIEWKTGDPP